MEGGAGFLGWLEMTSLSQAMRFNLWLYPIVEIVHIVGFVTLVGAVAMFDLRVLGFAKVLPVQALGRHLLRWSLAGLVLVVPAGLMMFSAHPHEFLDNRVFQIKLILIAAAGLNALLFHAGVYRSVAGWNSDASAPALAQAQALASLAIWIAVISCGRLLAYT
ncbi:hypothetical protein [Noviherbaspirillum sp.]|uniref:hypothetical protein n=1 Tax=Noviherbaspirillum sp. TaxID=1926288 RepID=UPI002D599DB6|nr:hypothetical protein [Noviherbaspirillum sp.]HZW23164.1 hypothetical protein [Noviherbaspirillum sp.]